MSFLIKWYQRQSNVLNHVGGWKNLFYRKLRECDVCIGTLVGKDKYGNEYFENNEYFMGRNRFVKYPYRGRMEYDASQVPPEWHRWLQNMTDDPPSTHPPTERKFFLDHQPNLSGTPKQYVPYSTTKPKIEAWRPNV